MTDVAHDADDLVSVVAHPGDQTFAQRFFIRENCVDELLADDCYRFAFSDFLFGEVASTQKRNAQGAEVVLIDYDGSQRQKPDPV